MPKDKFIWWLYWYYYSVKGIICKTTYAMKQQFPCKDSICSSGAGRSAVIHTKDTDSKERLYVDKGRHLQTNLKFLKKLSLKI